MKNLRIRTASFILAGILLLTCWSVHAVRSCCTELLRCTNAVLDAMEQETAVLEQISVLEQSWNARSRMLRFFIPNQQLIELNAEIMQIRAHYVADSGETEAGIYAVQSDLEWIRRQELTIF